jgi:hypothetical protein
LGGDEVGVEAVGQVDAFPGQGLFEIGHAVGDDRGCQGGMLLMLGVGTISLYVSWSVCQARP